MMRTAGEGLGPPQLEDNMVGGVGRRRGWSSVPTRAGDAGLRLAEEARESVEHEAAEFDLPVEWISAPPDR